MIYVPNNKSQISNKCEWILYALVCTLVFEGIIRKVIPALSIPIFFLKDFLCLIAFFRIFTITLPVVAEKLRTFWKALFFLFLPLLFFTAWKDFILAVFACKQYLLYLVTCILAIVSFPNNKEFKFRNFLFFATLLLIPTTIVAILQNALPATHWLNVSVGGDSLEAFSAAGYLRVGSTFSFTGQYSWFLNAESFLLSTSFFMQPNFKNGLLKRFKFAIYLGFGLALIIGVFITGGRTAVLGCGATLSLGFIFLASKRPQFFIIRVIPIILCCAISLLALRATKPEFFSAYDERSSGNQYITHNQEIANRIFEGFTDWTDWFWIQDTPSVLLGNGLGVMSNGASLVSFYASGIRSSGFWTEGDVPTTFWEGGLYLAVIWYGFRLSIIILCYRMWNSFTNKVLVSAASVPFAYVIIHGLIAQFGIQPPLSIWWWLAIGIISIIYQLERSHSAIHKIERF